MHLSHLVFCFCYVFLKTPVKYVDASLILLIKKALIVMAHTMFMPSVHFSLFMTMIHTRICINNIKSAIKHEVFP